MQIGDLFAKLGQGQTLSVGEIETLRLETNNIQGITASISKYLDPAGGLTMPGSWTMLGDKTLVASAADITLDKIPNRYRHLRLIARLRSDRADTGESVGMRFNGDTGNNYYSCRARWANDGAGGLTVVSSERFADSFMSLTGAVGANAPANVFGVVDYTIVDYAATASNKSICSYGGNTKTVISGGQELELASGTWASTAAIVSILLYPAAGGTVWVANSRATLYGLAD